jgi:hypothetical protein
MVVTARDIGILIKTCEEDQQSTAAQDSVISIIKIASSVFVKPDPGKVLDSASQLFSAVNVLVASSSILATNFSGIGGIDAWDPETTIPPLGLDSTPVPTEYTHARSSFYLSAAKSLTESLVKLSPAYWDNMYLQTEKRIAPLQINQPKCSEKNKILLAYSDFLSQVKSFTNYASSMTAAQMSLAPVSINFYPSLLCSLFLQ